MPEGPLVDILQSIIRPSEFTVAHLEAIGVRVTSDAAISQVIPGGDHIVQTFAKWDEYSRDECHPHNEASRLPLSNGRLSPGCLVYFDRKQELSTANEAAFRAVRRIPPPKGQSQARLGNAYEFFRHLEMFSAFWDDTSRQAKGAEQQEEEQQSEVDLEGDTAMSGTESPKSTSTTTSSPDKPKPSSTESLFYRTGTGSQLPAGSRDGILTAFLKLVAYDFGCNVSVPRIEPRLHLKSTIPGEPPKVKLASYFRCDCTFINRTPTTREAARALIVEGPLAAVYARHTTSFTERDAMYDFSRELIAALITAQYRAREGKSQERIGKDVWWASKPRWGGGPGGPIGKEIDSLSTTKGDEVVGDKDAPPPATRGELPEIPVLAAGASLSSPYPKSARPGGGSRLSFGAQDDAGKDLTPDTLTQMTHRRPKKSGQMPEYDRYRMVRPPTSSWDKKVRYEAIGRLPGADYDDIFVISCLFHHISVLRVRVPDRLLVVLDGAEEKESRSWGGLEVVRSKWFDFFLVEDRVEAMRCIWGVMAWLMRKVEG
jgi:hypothetical protein